MSWSMESTHESAVAPAEVFRYYADPATWGQWAHNTAWGRGILPLEAGAKVEVRVRTIHGRIRPVSLIPAGAW